MSRESRLKVGVDVPWVTSWNDEESLGVRPGMGKPQYSMNHFRRQRETVGRMLCPMCGQATPPGDRWTQIARRVPAGVLRAKGLATILPAAVPDDRIMIDAGSIAPLHHACVRRSLEHCPHLKAHPGVDVMAWPERWTVAPLLVQTLSPPSLAVLAARRETTPPRVAVGFLQVFGLTEDRDPRWRRRLRELEPVAGHG